MSQQLQGRTHGIPRGSLSPGIRTSSGDSKDTHHEPLLRRLNGRPQACDPCRRRKVACDNTLPICNRCSRRNQETRCIYTISDQTATTSLSHGYHGRLAGPAKRAVTRRSGALGPLSNHRRHSVGDSGSTGEPTDTSLVKNWDARTSNADTAARIAKPLTSVSPPRLTRTCAFPHDPGHLGFCSFSEVFDETRASLSLLKGSPPTISAPSGSTSLSGAAAALFKPSHCKRCSATRGIYFTILRGLPDPNYPKLAIPSTDSPAQTWGLIAVQRILETLRRRYSHVLSRKPQRDDVKLELMAQEICDNSSAVFDSDLADPVAFMDQFAGDRLRWESLGLLFAYREMAPDCNGSGAALPPEAPSGKWETKSGALELWPEESRTCLHACIEMARCFGDGNSLMMLLSTRLMIIDSLIYGDSSLASWPSHGAAVSLLTFLGLHALPNPPDYKPSLASEIKRRCFAFLFAMDKIGASFHGRPPMLNRRYTSSPLPLHISDEALMEGGEELDRAIASLDVNGWNMTEHGMGHVVRVRCRTMLAKVKDELMELALGGADAVSLEGISNIKRRAQAAFASFPEWTRYSDKDLDDADVDVKTLYSRIVIQLEYLQCQLFAERLAHRHGGSGDGSLLFVSFEIVRHVLILWMHMDRFEGLRINFLWLVMCYGAPGGGVLCMELLYPSLPAPSSPGTDVQRISRSSIIQTLSLLVGFLSWAAAPPAPNAELVADCKTVIQSVLDHALNTPSAGPGLPFDAPTDSAGLLEGFDPAQLDFGFDMFGTYDWFHQEEALQNPTREM